MTTLILAAGAASRFGAPKALLPAGEHQTVLSRVLELACRVTSEPNEVLVVLGRDADLMAAEVTRYESRHEGSSPVRTVRNPNYQRGLSSSLKTGLRALDSTREVLVLLADQPAVEVALVNILRERYQQGTYKAVSAAFQGQQRPPVILGPELYQALLELTGDQGAKVVLQRHPHDVALVEWDEGVWRRDIDTWEDYTALAHELWWHHDPTPRLQVHDAPQTALIRQLQEALLTRNAPQLTQDIVILPSAQPTQLVCLPPNAVPNTKAVVVGDISTPEAYLQLLRRAALTLLNAEV